MQWDGKYKFEAGDIVDVVGENNPFKGMRGLVSGVTGEHQFRVTFPLREIDFWEDNLLLVETHRTDNIPDTFKKAFD